MWRRNTVVLLAFIYSASMAQPKSGGLTVEKIMRDANWIGTSPSNVSWSHDGQYLYFDWNPDNALSDSVYFIALSNHHPVKASVLQKQNMMTATSISWNFAHTAYVFAKDGDVLFTDTKNGKTKRIVQTTDRESNPQFSFNDTKIVYNNNQNLYAWDIATGETIQLTNLQTQPPAANPQQQGTQQSRGGGGFNNRNRASEESAPNVPQEQWLKNDQLQYFQVLKERKEKRDAADVYNKSVPKAKELRTIQLGDRSVQGLNINPSGRYITYRLIKTAADAKSTIVPSYVTETGFTTDIVTRTKVGATLNISDFFIYDRERDTVLSFKADSLPGIHDLPDYVKDYPGKFEQKIKNPPVRSVTVGNISWSPKGTYGVLDIRSQDNKDRWLVRFDTAGRLKLIDRQRDEAWIGGPGTSAFGGANAGWIDETNFWFQSEATGYSHLYRINVVTGEKRALTSGKYEVQQTQLSKNKKYFYLTTNEFHPGEQQFYRLSVNGGSAERITTMAGANQATISPDEKYIAILYSYSNKPWELYLQENTPGGKLEQITTKAMSDEFKSYSWRDPELITFGARDGAQVYARVYRPTTAAPGNPAVVFVHGAGYLQNAHRWWSSYFREYMFNNLLADNGYYVIDADYRGSAGYGRDWRTAIYRHMGGKDLDDNVDAVNYLIKNYGVDPKRVGIYGGSYGGFITLMALFTTPDVFAAGAALRPVTDWANYNHGYTSNILNEPYNDSLAYRKSSPYYFAEGLKSPLLICHGMIDVNVHFQDAVKLTQRLIELGKDNWEIAPYPLEDHGFVEPSSWTDEYKRIFKLFETTLKK